MGNLKSVLGIKRVNTTGYGVVCGKGVNERIDKRVWGFVNIEKIENSKIAKTAYNRECIESSQQVNLNKRFIYSVS